MNHRGRYGCKIAGISREICYVRFARTAVVASSTDSHLETVKGDRLVFDFDDEGRLVGFELIGNKPCQDKFPERRGTPTAKKEHRDG